MLVHSLNCATLCPPARLLVNGAGTLRERGHMVCHCLLVETPSSGLVLVDTGLGLADVTRARERLGLGFVGMLGPRLDPGETAVRQIEALGYRVGDVRHVVLTHLDPDHAGGLTDFPEATVHLLADELDDARLLPTLRESVRYRPGQWAHGARFITYREGGASWFGFSSVRALEGLPPEILLVPLAGHTRGHAAIAIRTRAGWWLHAGDAYFHRAAIRPSEGHVPFGIALVEQLDAVDRDAVRRNHARLRELDERHGHEVRIVCAHDPVELARARVVA